MPDLKMNFPQVPDGDELQDAQYTFDGKWLPDLDPSLIGPENYTTLENLRYKDKGLEGVSGYTTVNSTALTTYVNIRNGHQLRTTHTKPSYVLAHAIDGSGNGRVYQNQTAIGSQGDFESTQLHSDASANLVGRFSDAPQSNVVYCNGEESMIWAGEETRIAAAFLVDDATGANPVDVTDAINTSLQTTNNFATINKAAQEFLVLMTTRPLKGFKFYIKTPNATTSTLTAKYWSGSAWVAVGSPVDNTDSGGIALAQTGTFTFTDTDGSVKPKHFQELYLYAYLFELSAGSAEIYQITANAAFQTIKDVWDGVYRQPIQFQYYDNDHYEDFTLHVNQSSDVNIPIGGELKGLVAVEDHVIIMFEEQQTAIKLIMLGGLVNEAASVMTVKYWNGTSYAAVADLDDDTDVSGDTLAKTGLISWTVPTTEEKQTLFGSVGYAYEITFSADLTTGTDVTIDLCYGIPTQKTVSSFDFSVLYKNRLMLGSFSAGNEGNRMDFSANNAPDVFNGTDSSNDGAQSLYFGNETKLTCGTQLYNRFGSNIFAMLLVFKESETYLLTGDTPSSFKIFPVSLNTGCPAPLTLATAEVGFEAGGGLQRQVAIWCSHAGPMMFDGAVVKPIHGVDLYFDPSETEFVEWDNMDKARGWVDNTFKEYNLLLPSGSGQTINNVWLVYDLVRKKWFKKDTGTETMPQSGWRVMHTTGEQGVYGGLTNGKVVELEEGTSWAATYADPTAGSTIDQKVRTGDFFPSNNIWDEVLIRKFKIICEKLTSATDIVLSVSFYENSATSASSVVFQDSDAGIGTAVDFEDMDVDSDGVLETQWASAPAITFVLNIGSDRLLRLIKDLNQLGWTHSFEFSVSTTTIGKGWKPIAWGIRYRVERKDDTAT
jgi:hypothetical protein